MPGSLLPVRRSTGTASNSSDDARFNIHFWVAEETDGENGLFHAKKA